MELKIKGPENKIKKFLKMNSLFIKRNKIDVIEGDNVDKEESSEEEALKLEVLELVAKNEALEGENSVLTENHEQLSNELIESKGLVSERDEQVLELNGKINELNNQLNSEVEVKETRKRRTKAEMEADNKDK